jgi:quinol monooxygenase YgiN
MNSNHVTVVYKWTAQPGKLEELTEIYKSVTAAMQENEPGAETVHVYASPQENALYVRDEFTDADAVGFHLGTTAGAHFADLAAIATPGPFFFLGEVPDELKAATEQMQLGGQFATHVAGFDRTTAPGLAS